jgi:hypothetical protein
MRTEFHCPCGHIEALQPAKLKNSLRCGKCGAESVYLAKGSKVAKPIWLLLGRADGNAEHAMPVPAGQTLKIGSRDGCWLVLDGIEPVQTQMTLEPDGRISIKDVANDHNTWINRAKILTGVIGPGDALSIGGWRLAIRGEGKKKPAPPKIDPAMVEVVVEDDDATGNQPAIDDDATTESRDEDISGESARRLKIRSAVSIGILCAAAAYWAWMLGFAASPADMPETTVYRCPADGTLFRGSWQEGSAKCPQCGALCFGSLKYKPESTGRAKPSSMPTTREVERGSPGSSPASKKKSTKTSAGKKAGDATRKPPR